MERKFRAQYLSNRFFLSLSFIMIVSFVWTSVIGVQIWITWIGRLNWIVGWVLNNFWAVCSTIFELGVQDYYNREFKKWLNQNYYVHSKNFFSKGVQLTTRGSMWSRQCLVVKIWDEGVCSPLKFRIWDPFYVTNFFKASSYQI